MISSDRAALWFHALLAFATASGLTACKQGLSLPEPDAGRATQSAHSNAIAEDPEPEPCERSEDGEPCADGKHCIKQKCVFDSCGDGVKAGDEECDDGNALLGDMCSPSCKATPASCGDGNLDEGEECDDGNRIDLDACANSCTKNVCGNKRIDPGEECDDGDREDGNACSNSCTHNLCRNGVVDPGEECDDANTNPNDGCTNACQRIVCGDGMGEQQEECDDGNRVNTDGCSNACTSNICGNNRLDPGEVCDGPKTADGKPIPEGSLCEKNCSGIKSNDACRECERRVCSNYLNSGVDLPKYCYDEEPMGTGGLIKDFNKKCTALARCIQQNACDINTELPEPEAVKCYCGKNTTIDACFSSDPTVPRNGPCVAEYEAAAGVLPGDFVGLSNFAVDQTRPSGIAWLLSHCQADVDCRSVCR
jgi:cysteine-rich repeat protein